MKVLITGGHFSPGFAVLKELISRGHEVAFIGRRFTFEGDSSESFEYLTLKKEKIKFFEINTGRIQRKLSSQTIPSLLKVPKGLLQARRILKEYNPDVVLTFGGYLAFPVTIAATSMGIPVVLHEQTQKAGLASRVIANLVSKICISFESSYKFFPNKKTIYTGIPLRAEVTSESITVDKRKQVIYITGGSSGSHFINIKIAEILPNLLEDYILYHQTGENNFQDYEKLSKIKADLPPRLQERYYLGKFFDADRVGVIFNKADLIVSRAGINTVCEILANGKIALLIPLSHGQKDEQLNNAKLIAEVGTGEFLTEDEAMPVRILTRIRYILGNPQKYLQNEEKARKYIQPDAAKRIVKVLEELTNDKKKIKKKS